MTKQEILNRVEEYYILPDAYLRLMEKALGSDPSLAFHASWVLESLVLKDIKWIEPNTLDFLNQFARQRQESSMRHFYKILALITASKYQYVFSEKINNYDFEALIDLCFTDLLSADVKVAIKSHILNVLANLCRFHEWIKSELEDVMDLLVDKESIAFFAKVKMIRKQLKSIK